MYFGSLNILPIIVSFALALVLTPVVRRLARHWGMVAQPKADRWHNKPTAMMGGLAVFLTVVITYLIFVGQMPHRPYGWVVMLASAFLFVVGLIDDIVHVKPYQKLIGQVMGASLVVYYGLSLPWSASPSLNMAITIFWLVGITNALNLLDNMDGLAAGIAAIAAAFLAASFVVNGRPAEALMLGVFAASLVGFLAYNSNPATIFMGDCGSMFIGFFLASAALMSAAGARSRSFMIVLAVPVLILLIPIFDTTFVTILRKLSGRSASQGGRDHTSHRLVALGMTERRAVWMLYGFAGLSGVLALLVSRTKLDVSVAAIVAFTIVLALLGVYLAGVKVYEEEEVLKAREKPLVAFFVDLSYKRRIFEVLLDMVLVILSYYSAYTLLFGPIDETGAWNLFLRTVPVLVCVKMFAFLAAGVYRGLWRYISVDGIVVFAKAVLLGSVGSVLALLVAFRFEGLSRAVFVLDTMILFMMLAGSRFAFRLFRHALPVHEARGARRVLIYGAGDGGELLLREVLNNRDLQLTPVGFVDDDPHKKGKVIHGLRVFGGNGSLKSICEEQRVAEVLISSTQISEERLAAILQDCESAQVTLKRMRIQIDQLN
ncbi:MAG: UDP-GlcNAc:undecaprenyl-phosphate/decaprenyl-phosphate GlcNAc-phosphate transferase [Pyrinomonadaceae bacterium]|nr:UDP-GlcNAc:undecaprenyl-phosphate/decaprenyl-phosphate GlcNAc-phosphate transferase [Pyrinomonadaceae bacterium]